MADKTKVQKGMDFLSTKMGLAGSFIIYVFYFSPAPELLRIQLATTALMLYLISQKTGDIIGLIYHPEKFDGQSFMDRMSKTLSMTGGFLAALFQAEFSPELKLWAGFIVTVTYLVLRGVQGGIRSYFGLGASTVAKLESSSFAMGGGSGAEKTPGQ